MPDATKTTRAIRQKDIIVAMPTMLLDAEFRPTQNMGIFMAAYLQALVLQPDIKPLQVISKTHIISVQQYYIWRKKAGFQAWIDRCVTEFFEHSGLTRVHTRIYETACDNSAQDRKLFLERFDAKYRPTQGLEHSVLGQAPPDNDQQGACITSSEERRKLIDSTVKDAENSPKTQVKDDTGPLAIQASSPLPAPQIGLPATPPPPPADGGLCMNI